MAMLAYDAPREIARIAVVLRRSADDMERTEVGDAIPNPTLSRSEFSLCNGKPHKTADSTFSRRRQAWYSQVLMGKWYNGAKASAYDDDNIEPPSAEAWEKLPPLLEKHGLEIDTKTNVDDLDGDGAPMKESLRPVDHLARISWSLACSMRDMRSAEKGEPVLETDMSAAEFELCGGNPSAGGLAEGFSRRRQILLALRAIKNWSEGVISPPTKDDWKMLGPVMDEFYGTLSYEGDDDEKLHKVDTPDSENGDEEEAETEEEESEEEDSEEDDSEEKDGEEEYSGEDDSEEGEEDEEDEDDEDEDDEEEAAKRGSDGGRLPKRKHDQKDDATSRGAQKSKRARAKGSF